MLSFNRIRENRSRMELDLRESWMRKYLSPALLGLYRSLVPRLRAHARGRLLDAGCGTMPFREFLQAHVTAYHSLDIEKRVADVDFVADLQDMSSVSSESYETVLCTEVLEHVAHPDRLITEIWRVLQPGGILILSVPYLSRLHEEPHDYYRFTKYGLESVLTDHGFSVVEIVVTGSIFSFLGHQLSTAILSSLWHVPVINKATFFISAVMCTLPCYGLDKLTRLSDKFPLGYVVVAKKTIDRPNFTAMESCIE
jgi:SAM-dependent methyltransferase